MIKEFKDFIAHGSVLDMAVGFVMGAAFKAIIDSLVADIVTPLLNVFLGGVDFKDWVLKAGPIHFMVGNFINAVLSFLIIAYIMFLLVRTANHLRKKEPAPPATKVCPFCKSEIPVEATRCPHCTSELGGR